MEERSANSSIGLSLERVMVVGTRDAVRWLVLTHMGKRRRKGVGPLALSIMMLYVVCCY